MSPNSCRLVFSSSGRRGLAAFSLVETVIAIGVVSFAMTGILGLVPVGLAAFQDAMKRSVEAAIVQEISSELQSTEFSSLRESRRHFDDQGTPAAAGIYEVEISAPRPLQSGALIASSAASTVLISVHNRTDATGTNRYSVIIPQGRTSP